MLRRFFGRWQTSFRFRLVISTTLAIAITVALYSSFQYALHNQQAEKSQRLQAEQLTNLIAQSLSQPMYDLNTLAIVSTVNALKAHTNIRWIRVKDSDGETLVDTSAGLKEGNVLLRTKRSIEYKEEKKVLGIGSVELAFSRKPLDSELSSSISELLIGSLLVTLGAVIAALWAFRVVTQPLSTITTSLGLLAGGNTNVDLPEVPSREDEFGRMSMAVRRFRDTLVERQQADQKVRASEKRFRDFSTSSADWFWETDEKMCVSYMSDNFDEVFGPILRRLQNCTLKEIAAQDTLNPPSLWGAYLEKLEQHLPFRNFEFKIPKPNGELAFVSVSGIPYTHVPGVFAGYRGIGQDITLRKKAEEEARKLSLAVEQSPNAVMITNSQGLIEYVNESFTRITGYSQEEAIGKNPRILKSDKTCPETFATLWSSLAQGRSWEGELVNRRKDGSLYVAYGVFAPLRQSDGGISNYLSICTDMTDRKRIENELAEYRLKLESMVEERTRQLAEAKDAAEAASRAKSAFVANMSHEIRTPLNAVLGLAKIIVRENQGRRSGETAKRITEAGEHLLGVINDILDYSKMEAGKLPIEASPFCLTASINEAIGLVTERAWSKGLSLRTELSPDVPQWVIGDRLRFEQILINLLANAVKFTEQGEIALTLYKNGEMVQICVSDTGIGISEEQMTDLFQPFEQADVSTTRKYGGSGLGLAISRNLARRMGGDITLKSRPGQGSAFELSLPLKETTPEAESIEQSKRNQNLNGIRILAVEDVELNRLVLEDILGQEGALPQFAEHGQQALDLIQKVGISAFDIILTDIQMPIMDGYEFSRHVRALDPNIPIVGLTARAMTEEYERCIAAGMQAHVTKPIDENELVATILHHTGGDKAIVQAPATKQAPIPETESKSEDLIDWEALSARYAGRQGFSEKLLGILLDTHEETPKKLRKALEDNDRDTLKHLAHTLQGIAGNIEAPSVRQQALDLENALANGADDFKETASQLTNTLHELIQMIKERIENQIVSPQITVAGTPRHASQSAAAS